MSNTAKIIGKHSFIAATALDLLGILISFFFNANLTNDILLRIVLFCYCIRFELIVVLIILITSYLLIQFFKSARKVNPMLFFVITMLIIVAIVCSVKPTRQYIIARYYYFNNKLYKDESQKRFLDNAQNYLDNNEWNLCKENLTQANALYPDSYYSSQISKALNKVDLYISYGEILHNSYIEPTTSGIPLNTFKCSQTLCIFYPSKYETEYLLLRDSVKTAINAYQLLYKAVAAEDYEDCRALISHYGWCWFEPTVHDRLSYNNESKVMEWLNQYISNEELYSAQSRMARVWFGEDSISTIIQ